ncbi:MAG: hypothetical protein AB8E82_20700 [Aureispira sp.]
MTFFIGCFFCIIIGWNNIDKTITPPSLPHYQMLQDTTRPQPSSVVTVKELAPKKKRNKQKATKKRSKQEAKSKNETTVPTPPQDSLIPTNQATAPKKNTSNTAKETPLESSKSKKKIPTIALSPEEELRLLATSSTNTSVPTPAPSTNQCAFAFDHVDEFTGTRKRGLPPRLFFAYTPEQYRKFLKTKDFMRCEGYLSQNSEGSMTLNIVLSIASAAAKEKFGDIPANSNMTIKTMQGKEFFLKSYKGAKAVVQGSITSYEGSFVLTKTDAKHLATAEVDQVRLRFTEGFQIYEVYYLDFLREQFPCFER